MTKTDDTLFFTYRFQLDDGQDISYTYRLDAKTLDPVDSIENKPDWASMDFHACPDCNSSQNGFCPVALRLSQPLELFAAIASHSRANVSVETNERTYSRETDVQQGLQGLFGLIMGPC